MTAVATLAPRSTSAALVARPYQSDAATAAADALRRRGDTLLVVPTGGGKTIIALLTAIVLGFRRALILVHRDELVGQWLAAVERVMPDCSATTVTAAAKDFRGRVIVAMVQTLARPDTLEATPAFDLVIVDEAHHAVAPTWMAILAAARRLDAGTMILGVTATPERADGTGLRRVFSNVAAVVGIDELIGAGYLVPPRAFALSVAPAEELATAARSSSDGADQPDVAAVLNRPEVGKQIVASWREKATDRRTIAFTADVAHAHGLADAFRADGVKAEAVSGATAPKERAAILGRLNAGETQVVANAQVLTEGFDEPLVSCVAIARACGSKSTMIQMAGRGLRCLDAERHPGEIKTDCILLDFAGSLARVGNLLAGTSLADRGDQDDERAGGEGAPTKTCPGCEAEVPRAVISCPICRHVFATEPQPGPVAFGDLIEVDVLRRSAFRWTDVAQDTTVAMAFDASAVVVRARGLHVAVGIIDDRAHALRIGTRVQALAAADDFLSEHGDARKASKTASWLSLPPSPRQAELLAINGISPLGLDRYAASAKLTWVWKKRAVWAAAFGAIEGRRPTAPARAS